MQIIETPRGYEITFEFRPTITKEVKETPGARFFGKEKGWFVPHQADFKRPDGMTIKVYTKPYIEKLKSKYVVLSAGADAPEQFIKISELPELTVKLPMKMPPFPYQANGIARGMELKKFINGDQPGLGKTFQAIGTILGLEATGHNVFPCLVICPTSLKENWRREWEEKFSHKRAIVLSDQNKKTWHGYYRMGMADVFIVNYESLKKFFVMGIDNKKGEAVSLKNIRFNPTKDLIKSVIIDELHKLNDPGTLQSKFTRGLTFGKEVIIGLTGTPVVNKPRDLASQLSIIERIRDFGGHKYFIDRYCAGGNGATNLNELNGKLNNICFFRREKADVLKDLPDKMREVVLCDISTAHEYKTALTDLQTFLRSSGYSQGEMDKSLKAEALVKIGILKSISARGKLEMMIEHIQEVVDAGEKIVVFIHQKFMAQSLLRAFPDAVTVKGDDDAWQRQANVDKFQACGICGINQTAHTSAGHDYKNNNTNLIICSLGSGGVGITLTASSRLVFGELPWHSAATDQCEDRIHRIGQKNSAQITYFLGKNTIDEDIYKMIDKKRAVAGQIVGSNEAIDTMITDLTRTLFNQKI